MTAIREPLPRWRYPDTQTLSSVFPSGRPPFAPFPTVTNLVNANLCPVAVYHDLLHGLDNALMGQYPQEKRGELFQKFIAHLKFAIRNGSLTLTGYDIQTQQGRIRTHFLSFAQREGFSLNEAGDLWREYVEPYSRRKLQNGELINISPSDQFFFEISVANDHIPFALDAGIRNYPLRGRIDEIDFTNRRIIERTIKGGSTDNTPPLLKDYQVWLLAKLLCSLELNQMPSSWNGIRFQDFSLFVETPFNDFPIPFDNSDFVTHTHYSYAWINDISLSESPRVNQEVFENAACTPVNPHPVCAHPFINCFVHNYPYPQSRPEIRQAFQPWYRLLLWEQKWKGHLWQYQLLLLSRQELINRGLILEARMVSSSGNQLEIEIIGRQASSLRGYEYCTIIPYGSVFCGLRINARLIRVRGNNVFMEYEDNRNIISHEVLLLPSEISPPIMKEPLTFLDRQTQSALFRLQHIGADNLNRAQQRSVIQLLEAIFGIRPIQRE
ncbi:MAG: hypothetical protein HY707_12690 [Ignavibacteriae bacterium]|nr:hypothetical protein [Ignavibacteriota bacterium]